MGLQTSEAQSSGNARIEVHSSDRERGARCVALTDDARCIALTDTAIHTIAFAVLRVPECRAGPETRRVADEANVSYRRLCGHK